MNRVREESIVDVEKEAHSPNIWLPGEDLALRPDVRQIILQLSVPFTQWGKITDVFLIGSLTTKQYTDESDLDITLIIEPFSDESLRAAKTAAGTGANLQLLPGTSHPINYYVRQDWDETVADQVYDILGNKWLKQTEIPEVTLNKYMDTFGKIVSAIDLTKAELKRDIVDYEGLSKFTPEQATKLQQMVQKKVDEIDFDVKKLASTYKVVHSLRKMAFRGSMTPEEIKDYHIKNLLPANVVYKLLCKYHYDHFLKAISKVLKQAGEKISTTSDVQAVKSTMMNVSIESAIDEMTTSGAAGAYDVPLGARPQGRRCRVKRKKKRIQTLV